MQSRTHPRILSRPRPRLTLALACALASAPALAQNNFLAAAGDTQTAAMPSFNIRPTAEYTLGPGDEVHVSLIGRDDINLSTTLGPDGRITLPIAGTIDLGGLTRDQATHVIETALTKYYVSPVVVLTVTRYASNTVLLLGGVSHPGLQTFDHQPTLLEVLAGAGIGSTENAGAGTPSSTLAARAEPSGPFPEKAIIYRGSAQMAEIDLRKLLAGESFSDIYLQRGDVVLVPVVSQLVSILGAVHNPGALPFSAQNTLSVLLAQAGGLDETAGGDPLIRVIHPVTNTVEEVHFKALLAPDGNKHVTLHSGDVIFVPTSSFAKFAYIFDKLNPITTALTIGLAYH